MGDSKTNDTLNQHWKNNKNGFGFKMLQKMGWKEDKGLGKNEDGIVVNLKVDKREVGLGLGMAEDSSGNNAWSETASSYNDVLALLKSKYRPESALDSDSDKANGLSSSSKKSKSKSKNKEKKSGQSNSKVVKCSSSSNSLSSIASSTARISVGMKYKRIRESKILSTKSNQDKAAIFGYHPSITSNTAKPSTTVATRANSSGESIGFGGMGQRQVSAASSSDSNSSIHSSIGSSYGLSLSAPITTALLQQDSGALDVKTTGSVSNKETGGVRTAAEIQEMDVSEDQQQRKLKKKAKKEREKQRKLNLDA